MVSGFTTGEGNFDVMISKSKSHSIGYRVLLRFRIYQNEGDIKLMVLLINYLGSGKIERSIDHNKSTVSLIIVKLSDINKK
jgi:LAGLIDADG endonuclease